MLFPIRLTAGGWPPVVERLLRRFVWTDPRIVQEPGPDAASFSRAMAAFAVGSTVKITGARRHAEADALLLEHLDLSDAVIVDLGASDGITSVELVERLRQFRQYVIADLYVAVDAVRTGRGTAFYDRTGKVIVVAGRRLVAWPSASRPVTLLYGLTLARAARSLRGRSADAVQQILLINPEARLLLERDPRVSLRTHDIFTPWPGPRPDVVKVANVLRRLYFSDDRILAALTVVLTDLPDGGHLLLVDNPRVTPPVPPRGCLYRRSGDRFHIVGRTGQPTEVHDLVLLARARCTEQASR